MTVSLWRRARESVQGGATILGKTRKSSVGVGADVFSSDLQPSTIGQIIILVKVDTAVRLDLHLNNGVDDDVFQLNGGTNLTANALHEFRVPVDGSQTINFQHSGTAPVTITLEVYFQEHIR